MGGKEKNRRFKSLAKKLAITLALFLNILLNINSVKAEVIATQNLIKESTIDLIGAAEEPLIMDSQSKYILKIANIDPNASHIKIKVNKKAKKKSNLKLISKRAIEDQTDAQGNRFALIKIKTKNKSSVHNLKMKMYQKDQELFRTVRYEDLKLNVSGFEACPRRSKPVCGTRTVSEYCPDPNSGICFQTFATEHKTFDNFCKLEEAGFDLESTKACIQEGVFLENY